MLEKMEQEVKILSSVLIWSILIRIPLKTKEVKRPKGTGSGTEAM
jgi:hypothetical protein